MGLLRDVEASALAAKSAAETARSACIAALG